MNLLGMLLPLFADVGLNKLADEYVHSFRGRGIDRHALRFAGSGADAYATVDPQGLRLTLPSPRKRLPAIGVATLFKARGDFEITVAIDVLRAEKPDAGYGSGAVLYVKTDGGRDASFARNVLTKGDVVFVADLMRMEGGQLKHRVRSFPTQARSFQLRLTRTGSTLEYSVAEGSGGAFRKLDEANLGAGDVSWIQVSADPGGSFKGALDVRFKDLTIRAEELPSSGATLRKIAAWKSWLIAGTVVAMVAAFAAGFWRFYKAGRPAAREP
jgi:hypothetical protein